jgi:hypothetical protein
LVDGQEVAVHWVTQLVPAQMSPHTQSLVRAQVGPPSGSFGRGAQSPETQAGPLISEPPSGRQSQLEVHWPGVVPPVELPPPLLPALVLPPVPPFATPQVPLALQVSPVGHSALLVQSTQTPSVQLPAPSAVMQSRSVEQGTVSPESLSAAVVGLQESAKAAAAKAMGSTLRMATSNSVAVERETYR